MLLFGNTDPDWRRQWDYADALYNRWAVWSLSIRAQGNESGISITPVAVSGEPAPGVGEGVRFNDFKDPQINDFGEVLFISNAILEDSRYIHRVFVDASEQQQLLRVQVSLTQ